MSELTTHETLVKARNLISDEKNWCGTGWDDGTSVCVLHALSIAEGVRNAAAVASPSYAALKGVIGIGAGAFNDSHSYAEVLAALDRAIAQTAPEPDVSFVAEDEAVPA